MWLFSVGLIWPKVYLKPFKNVLKSKVLVNTAAQFKTTLAFIYFLHQCLEVIGMKVAAVFILHLGKLGLVANKR